MPTLNITPNKHGESQFFHGFDIENKVKTEKFSPHFKLRINIAKSSYDEKAMEKVSGMINEILNARQVEDMPPVLFHYKYTTLCKNNIMKTATSRWLDILNNPSYTQAQKLMLIEKHNPLGLKYKQNEDKIAKTISALEEIRETEVRFLDKCQFTLYLQDSLLKEVNPSINEKTSEKYLSQVGLFIDHLTDKLESSNIDCGNVDHNSDLKINNHISLSLSRSLVSDKDSYINYDKRTKVLEENRNSNLYRQLSIFAKNRERRVNLEKELGKGVRDSIIDKNLSKKNLM